MTPQEAKEIQEIKSRAESNTHQIEELKASVHHLEDKQDAIYKMSENLSLMAQSLKNVEEDVSDVKQNQKERSNKVSTLENQPSRESLENIRLKPLIGLNLSGFGFKGFVLTFHLT